MTIAQAASSATLSGASAPRRAAVHLEVEAQEEAHREVARQEALRQEIQAVVAVAQAVMRTIITHLAAEAEAAGDSFLCHKTDKTFKTIVVGTSNGTQPGCRCYPRLKSGIKTQLKII